MTGLEHVIRRHASPWMLLLPLALGLLTHPACGQCPPCQEPNPNYDPNHPYPDEQSEPECINKPETIPKCEPKEKSCPKPDVSGEPYFKNGQWISGHVKYSEMKITAECKEGCDGNGGLVYKAVGDVSCDIEIWVAEYAPIRGSPLICGPFKKKRTAANIQSTIDQEMIHCEDMVGVLRSLQNTLCNSPKFTSSQECEDFLDKYEKDAKEYWDCKRTRNIYHCDFTGHRGSTYDDCGKEFPGDPLKPPGNCPTCVAP